MDRKPLTDVKQLERLVPKTAFCTDASDQASDDKSGETVGSLNYVGAKVRRSAVIRGRVNDARIWIQLEFEGVEAKGQSFPDGFQCGFLEIPKLEKSPLAFQTCSPFDSIRLGSRKKPMRDFHGLHSPRLIF